MAQQQNARPLFERMRLVIALTEVNSRHLRGESRRAGAEIELACALASEERDGVSNDRARDIAQLRERLSDAERELRSIEFERAQLEDELANLDSTVSGSQHGSWQ